MLDANRIDDVYEFMAKLGFKLEKQEADDSLELSEEGIEDVLSV